MLSSLDPFELAARQIEIDRESTRRHDRLFERKKKRLQQSPLGFLRGSARLFYEVLVFDPKLQLDEPARGAVVGDMHIENVGAYRTDTDDITFNLNDFDDAGIAPLWVDTLRLATSVLLAGRSFQATASESLALVHELLDGYEEALAGLEIPTTVPKPVAELVERAQKRSRKELLDMRAPFDGTMRRFVRGDRYFDLDEDERAELPALVDAYRNALGSRAPSHAASWKIQDAAHRIAGNGSLGRRRIALLLVDEQKTERIFELKEAKPSALEVLFGPVEEDPARRVDAAARGLVATPPRQLAALPSSPLGSFLGRKLCPEEDKLDLARLSVGKTLSHVGRTVGAIVGRSHRRSAVDLPPGPRSRAQRAPLVDRAVRLAGTLESVYLAYARLTETA
ncbi:MAG: DUF2252 family protein [Polyangiaceae bacterium]|nr:DUF2252 family protein [Polyangiaceae bacterium]